jgi:hypothetical protein
MAVVKRKSDADEVLIERRLSIMLILIHQATTSGDATLIAKYLC